MAYKLNLKKRILLGYLVPLLLTLGVAFAVYWSIQTVQRIAAALDRSRVIMEHVKSVHLDLIRMQRSTRGYIVFKSDDPRKSYIESRAQFEKGIKFLTDEVKDPKQQENLRRFSEFGKRMESVEQEFFDLIDAGKASNAAILFRSGKSIKLVGELEELAAELEKREGEIVAERRAEETNAMTQLMSVAVGATALAVLLAIALGVWIASRISQAISEAVAGMSTSSTEIAATVEQHERTVTQQAAAVNETTTTVEELGASARQSASQAEASSIAAKQSLGLAEEGIGYTNRATESMAAMKQKIGSVAEQILSLSERAGQIGGIAKLVGELAGETNMLALNAAVEAARAGEQGKGFAVVAAEVRKLADQSKKSAERTNTLVGEIQKATNSAVMVTEEGSRTAEDAAGITQKMVEAFGSIVGAVNGVADNAQQVMLNSKQQAVALAQVTEAMKSLAAGSTQMAAGTEQTKIGVQKLNQVALALKAMV